MRSHTSGLITTILIFVPLVAVPVLAVLGVPQISAGKKSPAAEELNFADSPASGSIVFGTAAASATPVSPNTLAGSAASTSPAPSSPPSSPAVPGAATAMSAPMSPGGTSPDAPPVVGETSPSTTQAQSPAGVTPTPPAVLSDSTAASDRPAAANPVRREDPFAEFDRPGSPTGNATAVAENRPPQRPILAYGDDGAQSEAGGRADTSNGSAAEPTAPEEQKKSKADTRLTSQRLFARQAVGDAVPANDARVKADAVKSADAAKKTDGGQKRSQGASAWKRAVDRLNALGIHDYRLQPGQNEGVFHFSCALVSRTNPRVTHRFEAEAEEPLEAFESVLQQIDEWQARRNRRNGDGKRTGEEPRKMTQDDPFQDEPQASAPRVTSR